MFNFLRWLGDCKKDTGKVLFAGPMAEFREMMLVDLAREIKFYQDLKAKVEKATSMDELLSVMASLKKERK